MEAGCIFCRIAQGEIPARIVLENEDVIAFRDTDPKAPTHILIIPRRHIASVGTLDRADAAVAGRLLLAAREIAESENVAESGFRIVTNTGDDAGQSVQHLHMHLLGGRSLKWPPG
jgi:histidine triad (HIT) family protein